MSNSSQKNVININDSGINFDTFVSDMPEDPDTVVEQPAEKEVEPKLNLKIDPRIFRQIEKDIERPDIRHEPEVKPDKSKIMTKKIEREKYILKIIKFQKSDRFRPLLDEYKIKYDAKQLEKMSDDELDNVYARIKAVISSKSADNFYESFIRGASHATENVVSRFYNVRGMTEILMKDPGFRDTIEELTIEYNFDSPYMTPSARILIIVMRTMLVANQLNEMQSTTQAVTNYDDEEETKENLRDNEPPIVERKRENITNKVTAENGALKDKNGRVVNIDPNPKKI